MNFDFLARRADAVETGRSTLRAYAMISEVVDTMKRLAIKQESETAQEVGTGSTESGTATNTGGTRGASHPAVWDAAYEA